MQITPVAPNALPKYTEINPWVRPGHVLDSKDTYGELPDGTKIPFPGLVKINEVNDLGSTWEEHTFTPQGRLDANISMMQIPGTDRMRLTTKGTWAGAPLDYTAEYTVTQARQGYAELVPVEGQYNTGKPSFFRFMPLPDEGFRVESELDLPIGMRYYRTGDYAWH